MSILDTALALASEGLPVFPCRENKAPACTSGFKDAETDPAAIRVLWQRYPGTLIGVPTGPLAGFDVLDLDPRHGAASWWKSNAARIPESRIHRTRSGGMHVLFLHDPTARCTASTIAAGIDTRSAGGYVIWWPAHGYRMSDVALAPWPDWLLLRVQRRAKPAIKLDGPTSPLVDADADAAQCIANRVLSRLASAPDGQRHFMLRKAAFTLGGLLDQLPFGRDEAAQRLLRAVRQAGAEDLSNAGRTALWGLDCGLKSPFQIEARR